MTRFLKLTNIIINTKKIIGINISPTKYTISIANHSFNGWMIFGGGYVESIENNIEIYQYKDPLDYRIVKDWIEQLK